MAPCAMRHDSKFMNAGLIAPPLLGVAAFFLVVGPRALNPMNISWLGVGDPATTYLGWHFFRSSDWSFPIGLNPDYGLELSNSILFSDSNPLLAILFKPFASLLPEPFQYFGLWLLACFVLQAWFGWKIVSLISQSLVIRTLGTGFFVFAPPMLWRLHGHLSLFGHFLVVGALYLVLRPGTDRRLLAWGALLVVAALVNAYLLAMVAILWVTDLTGRALSEELSIQYSSREFVSLAVIVGVACWQAGYFTVSGLTGDWGYGRFRMNGLSVLDARSALDTNGWSYVIKDVPEAEGDYEGFNFLGLGVIVLSLFAIPAWIGGRARLRSAVSKKPVLLLVLIGLTLYAVTNNVGIGPWSFGFLLPEHLLGAANIFRSSGRMFWPVFYALLLTVIFIVVRGYDMRAATYLLGLALVVQILDTSAGWRDLRKTLMTPPSSQWTTPLEHPFWADAATRYRKVRSIYPVSNQPPHWLTLSDYAGKYALATDAVYLARVGEAALRAARAKAAQALATGHYDADSLYILDERAAARAALKVNQNTDLFARIDGLNVLAPGWKQCPECGTVDSELRLDEILPPALSIGQRIEFSRSSQNSRYLIAGWSLPGDGGIWSDGPAAEIVLSVVGEAHEILIEAGALVVPSHPKQDIEIRVNGIPAATARLSTPEGNRIAIPIPDAARKALVERGFLHLEFKFPDAVRPRDIGMNKDARKLALFLIAITVF